MGELATLTKARQELEDLYLGVPDESVNLTFEDLAKLKNQHGVGESKKPNIMEPIPEIGLKDGLGLGKSPSLDFNRGLHAVRPHHQRQVEDDRMHVSRKHQHHVEDDRMHLSRNHQHHVEDDSIHVSRNHHHHVQDGRTHKSRSHRHHTEEGRMYASRGHHHHDGNSRRDVDFKNDHMDMSVTYDDVSGVSMAAKSGYHDSMAARSGYHDTGGRRRPGIPHSNICTICSTYIYIFRHRCLVCGRVYCRHCVTVGMGEMNEGRKCVECLGRRFSQRYIHRAGAIGCCTRYPSLVKLQELKWAEKGPKGSGPRGYGRSGVMPRSRNPVPSTMSARTNRGPVTPMTSRSRSPVTPRTPTHNVDDSSAHSFVASFQYSPFTPAHHPVPF